MDQSNEKTHIKSCPDCKEGFVKFVRGRYCLRCSECTLKYNKIPKKQIVYEILCVKCKNIFVTYHSSQQFCGSPCTNKKTQAEKWLARKPQQKGNKPGHWGKTY